MALKTLEIMPLATARGRNGYFTPRSINVMRYSAITEGLPPVFMDVLSGRTGKTAPIELGLSAQDAIEVGRALTLAGMGLLKDG